MRTNKWLPAAVLTFLVAALLLAAGQIGASSGSEPEDDLQVLEQLPQKTLGRMRANDIAALLSLD